MLLMCCVAFGQTGRFLKLTLLFLLLSCGLGGGVLLLGRASGGMARLGRAMVYAELPWGVFCAAAGLSYLLLTVIFRGGAKHDRDDFVRAQIEFRGRSAEVTLFRDTGNVLTDPLTGEGVPVIEKAAFFKRKQRFGGVYDLYAAARRHGERQRYAGRVPLR